MALLSKLFINSIVAIYGKNENLLGTGFFYKRFKKETGKNKGIYDHYLVTCRHVLEKESFISLKFTEKDNDDLELNIEKYKGEINKEEYTVYWYEHPNPEKDIDLVVIPIEYWIIQKYFPDGKVISSDIDIARSNVLKIEDMIKSGIYVGDHIYAVGFPNELTKDKDGELIVRNGIIAHIKSLFDKESDDFIIDSFIFPGNSGGPVILKPEAVALKGTQPHPRAYVLGIIKEHYSYQERAFLRSDQSRILFEDNSGLGSVYPIDLVEEIMDYHFEKINKFFIKIVNEIRFHPTKEELKKYVLDRVIREYKRQIKENNKNIPPQILNKMLDVMSDKDVFKFINELHWNDYLNELNGIKMAFNSKHIEDFMDREEIDIILKLIEEIELSD